MMKRHRNTRVRLEKEIVEKKALSENVARLMEANKDAEERIKLLEKELEQARKEVEKKDEKIKDWEVGFAKEHECRIQWEEAATHLKEKYEDEYGGISEKIYQYCLSQFVKSEEYRNLFFRTNYAMIRDCVSKAKEFVSDKLPEYEKRFSKYLDETQAKDYMFPWDAGFDVMRYCAPFPSDDEEGEDEGEDEEEEEEEEEEEGGEENAMEGEMDEGDDGEEGPIHKEAEGEKDAENRKDMPMEDVAIRPSSLEDVPPTP